LYLVMILLIHEDTQAEMGRHRMTGHKIDVVVAIKSVAHKNRLYTP
jgi:hypothetical protein